jgi:hypothetical protein
MAAQGNCLNNCTSKRFVRCANTRFNVENTRTPDPNYLFVDLGSAGTFPLGCF